MKMECWWNGEKELAREVDASKQDWEFGSPLVEITSKGIKWRVPRSSLHPLPLSIAPGTLVYAWDGDVRPKVPRMGIYDRQNEERFVVVLGKSHINNQSEERAYSHVELALGPKIDWNKAGEEVKCAVQYDSGAVWLASDYRQWRTGMQDRQGTVIAILHRPEATE